MSKNNLIILDDKNNNKSTSKLLKEVKDQGQDYEWYPTTREIIEAMYWDLVEKKHDESNYRSEGINKTILDIGAGNGKLFTTFKDIANEQPLLNEYYYHDIYNEEYYKSCTIKKVIGFGRYGADPVVILNDGNEDKQDTVDMPQFMLMLNNSSIEDIDLTEIDYTEEHCKISEKERLLKKIEDYEPPKSQRCDRERNANRVFITKYMAIEKSQPLINALPENTTLVGTDFQIDTLIDKRSDIVFCNPPYSKYSSWSEKIILEANADVIYLVIPKRWGKQSNIAGAIKKRRAAVKIVGDFDFENAEDRKARAKVSLVKIDLRGRLNSYRGKRYRSDEQKVDPFDAWFDTFFEFDTVDNSQERVKELEKENEERKEKIDNAIVEGYDLVAVLVKLYNTELEYLLNNYKKVGELDSGILKELNIDVSQLKSGLKEKIIGLKHRYWQEIFNNLDDITSRLTSRTRDALMNTLTAKTYIDFTYSNIRNVVIWVIKNANKYYEQQMLEVYDDFTTGDGIALYKSNKRFNDDTWRYNKWEDKDLDKYALDYRIVCHGYRSEYSWSRDANKLTDGQMQYLYDIKIIANNLGFKVEPICKDLMTLKNKHNVCFSSNSEKDYYRKGTKTLEGRIEEIYFHSNEPLENDEETFEKDGIVYVYYKDIENSKFQYKIIDKLGYEKWRYHDDIRTDVDIFTTVRGHNNGNVHFQFNKKFIKKLNLEVGRLRGWIKNPQDAANEFDISLEEANEYWKSTFQALPSTISKLLPSLDKKKSEPVESKEKNIIEESLIIENIDIDTDIVTLETTLDDDLVSKKNNYTQEDIQNFSNGSLF
jgi:hypothetical protein